jgi:hypothetical protein
MIGFGQNDSDEGDWYRYCTWYDVHPSLPRPTLFVPLVYDITSPKCGSEKKIWGQLLEAVVRGQYVNVWAFCQNDTHSRTHIWGPIPGI